MAKASFWISLLAFSAAVSPGPFQAYLLSHTMQHGLRRTVPSAFAPLISDGPIILIVLVALTQAPPWLLRGLQIAGGVFLVYTGIALSLRRFAAWRRRRARAEQVAEPEEVAV